MSVFAVILDLISWSLWLIGGFLLITGAVGVLRFPDFFSRIHAAGITESMATPLILIGLILQIGWSLESVKLFLIMIFVLATGPTATHAMASAALHGGEEPTIDLPDVELRIDAVEESGSSKH